MKSHQNSIFAYTFMFGYLLNLPVYANDDEVEPISEPEPQIEVEQAIEQTNITDEIDLDNKTEQEKQEIKEGIAKIKAEQDMIRLEMSTLVEMVQALKNIKSDAAVTLDEIADQIRLLEDKTELTVSEEGSVESIVEDVESLQKQQASSNEKLQNIEIKVEEIAKQQADNDESLKSLLTNK